MQCWVEKDDLKGTEYEHLMDRITDKELDELERSGKIMAEADRWKAEGSI